MYRIEFNNNNNKSLYTVIYTYGHLSLPLCQSSNYQDCVDYVNKQPKDNKVFNEEESQQALTSCLTQMYKNRNNGK